MIDQLCALFRRCFPYAVRSDDALRETLACPDNRIITREDDGRIIAAAVLRGNAVLMLAVDEPYRRHGIGAALLARVEEIIRAAGHEHIVIGVGDTYLTPGVPVREQPFPEALLRESLDPRIPPDNAAFFRKRGYVHREGEGNIFDMQMDITPAVQSIPLHSGMTCRFAHPAERAAVLSCAREAYAEFAPYYEDEGLYQPDAPERVFIVLEGDRVAGGVLVGFGTEGPGLSSIGCTWVHPAFRGRGAGTDMCIAAVQALERAGLKRGYLSYTYSRLDRMYGAAGFGVSCYYFMAKKALND